MASDAGSSSDSNTEKTAVINKVTTLNARQEHQPTTPSPRKDGAAESTKPSEKENRTSISGSIGRGIAAVTGFNYYRRTTRFVAERLTFPLLRRVISNELKSQKMLVDLSLIDTPYIEKTYFWQRYLGVFYLVVALYGLLSTTRGLAAGIRYDMWLTHWLYLGIAMLAFALARGVVTWKVIRSCAAELEARSRTGMAAQE